MQGTFQRDKPQEAQEKLDVQGDLLVHDRRQAKQKNATAMVDDGMGNIQPQILPEVDVVVFPPPQSFTLHSTIFLIIPYQNQFSLNTNLEKYKKSGYWLVPHVGIGNNQARPENVKNPLLDVMKDFKIMGDWSVENVFDNMTPFIPSIDYCRLTIDFQKKDDNTWQIQSDWLKLALDRAEELDYDFALRMQGLLNCAINAVWTCTEFGFDSGDRSHIMGQFLQKYIGRFLSQVTQKPDEIDPDRIVQEAMQMHRNFSSGWVKEHKRGLSPNLDACSEALVGHYCDGILKQAILAGMTRKQIARLLRRHPEFSAQFGLCLHFFMVKLDQDKNGRNANYKSMFNSTTNQLLQMRKLDEFLRTNVSKITMLIKEWKDLNEQNRHFHVYTMDWYYIISQLHTPTLQYTGVKRARSMVSRAPGVFFAQSS